MRMDGMWVGEIILKIHLLLSFKMPISRGDVDKKLESRIKILMDLLFVS